MADGHGLWVFRAGASAVSTARLAAGLEAAVARLGGGCEREAAERALVAAGEIEVLLADRGSPRVEDVARIVDAIADRSVGVPGAIRQIARSMLDDLPACVRPSPPEGFAFHGVTPGAFAALAASIDLGAPRVAVLGVRTIGTTLAAAVAAALRRRGVEVARASARPSGHPYDRALRPDPALARWIGRERDAGARFLVVDEGPGLSGSSFLAAAEALVREGVAPDHVRMLGTRRPDPGALVAPRAARRFAAFAPVEVAPAPPRPVDAGADLSGGRWRARFCGDAAGWPASWLDRERPKHLAVDGRSVLKFEGLGRFGDAVRARLGAIAAAGLGPPCADAGGGYARSPVVAGRPLARADLDAHVVRRLAEACALRATAFAVDDADPGELEAMVRHDAAALLGRPIELRLAVERPVVADARLAPHEWVRAPGGAPQKLDGAAHGDDALAPGPVDVAWDLAGAIAEWELDEASADALVAGYEARTGDRVVGRLGAYRVAYLVLGAARAALGAAASGAEEAARLIAERDRLLRRLAREPVAR